MKRLVAASIVAIATGLVGGAVAQDPEEEPAATAKPAATTKPEATAAPEADELPPGHPPTDEMPPGPVSYTHLTLPTIYSV